MSDFTTYDGKPLVSDFNDYQIQIEEAFRFNAEDTLVFRVAITNEIDAPLIYQPDSFTLRAGNRLYPQSISDADGTVPPKGRSIVYFAVTGTPDGGRNESVLEKSLHGAGEPPVTAAAARRHDHQCSRASHSFTQRPTMKPRDFLNFFKTKTGKLVVFGALFAAGLIIFSVVRKHTPSAEDAASVTALATNATDKPQVVQSVIGPCRFLIRRRPNREPTNSPVVVRRQLFQNPQPLPSGSREPGAIAFAHQSVCRQRGGHSAAQKIERRVCAVRTADSL